MMAKNAQARMDKAELAPLRAWAEKVVKADDILSRTIALENGIEALESRRATLSQEVADLLAKTETARQTYMNSKAEWDGSLMECARQLEEAAKGVTAERAARAKAAEDDTRAYKQRHDQLAAELREEAERLRAECKALREQRQQLQNDLAETLRKYAQAR